MQHEEDVSHYLCVFYHNVHDNNWNENENEQTTKTLLTPWFDKWGPMQQIKKKMINNQSRK